MLCNYDNILLNIVNDEDAAARNYIEVENW